MIPACQRIAIVVEVIDTGINEAIAAQAMLGLLEALQRDGSYPHLISLEIAPAAST